MWNIIGNFAYFQPVSLHGTILEHKIEYEAVYAHDQSNLITCITLLQYEDKSFKITIDCINEATANNFLSQCKGRNTSFYPFLSQGKVIQTYNQLRSSPSKNQTVILNSLRVMIEFDPHIILIANNICNNLGLEQNLFLAIDSLLAMPTTEAIADAIKVQVYTPKPIWELAQAYFHDSLLAIPQYNVDSQALYDLLSAISMDNPYYRAAQDLIVELLMRVKKSDDAASDLQLQFAHALNGTQQPLTDKLFEEMCGHAIRQSPLSNIQPDFNTLVKLAGEIKRLNDELRAQKVSPLSANPHRLFASPAPQLPHEAADQGLKKSFN